MRRLLLIAAGLLVLAGAVGQAQAPGGPGVSYPPLLLRDEGTDQGRLTKALNFTGAGVSCSASAGVGTCNVSGGGGGGGNFVESEVDFGANGNTNASVVVTGQAWVSGTSKIVCSPTMLSTTTRAEGAEDAIIEGLTIAVHSRVAGTGYTLAAAVREGRAYGKFKVHCTGT